MTVTDISTAPRLRFAVGARAIAQALRATDLVVPAFRTPPRRPGVPRTVRRTADGAVVAVAVDGRPFAAVLADLVEGVVVVNDLDAERAAELRDSLWRAIEHAEVGIGPAQQTTARRVRPPVDAQMVRPGSDAEVAAAA